MERKSIKTMLAFLGVAAATTAAGQDKPLKDKVIKDYFSGEKYMVSADLLSPRFKLKKLENLGGVILITQRDGDDHITSFAVDSDNDKYIQDREVYKRVLVKNAKEKNNTAGIYSIAVVSRDGDAFFVEYVTNGKSEEHDTKSDKFVPLLEDFYNTVKGDRSYRPR